MLDLLLELITFKLSEHATQVLPTDKKVLSQSPTVMPFDAMPGHSSGIA